MAIYSAYTISPQDITPCAICLEPLANGQTLAVHEGEGNKHPIHKTCLLEVFAKNTNMCPICRTSVNVNSLKELNNYTFILLTTMLTTLLTPSCRLIGRFISGNELGIITALIPYFVAIKVELLLRRMENNDENKMIAFYNLLLVIWTSIQVIQQIEMTLQEN